MGKVSPYIATMTLPAAIQEEVPTPQLALLTMKDLSNLLVVCCAWCQR